MEAFQVGLLCADGESPGVDGVLLDPRFFTLHLLAACMQARCRAPMSSKGKAAMASFLPCLMVVMAVVEAVASAPASALVSQTWALPPALSWLIRWEMEERQTEAGEEGEEREFCMTTMAAWMLVKMTCRQRQARL